MTRGSTVDQDRSLWNREQISEGSALAERRCRCPGSGLKPSSTGWRIKYSGGKRTVVDGPFAETKELVAGYTLIQAKSREEAVEWTKRFPNPAIGGKEGEIEVRQLFELEDFTPGESIAVAGRIPGARKGTVEIRPVQEIPGLPANADER